MREPTRGAVPRPPCYNRRSLPTSTGPPEMNLSRHRSDYAAYRSAVETERFRRHAGHTLSLNLRRIEERYAELWTAERIAELRRALDETPADFETERAGLTALIGASLIEHAERQARDVTDELRGCEAAARFDWRGVAVTALDAPELLAAEPDAAARGELFARATDALLACDDLRAARLESSAESARAQGFTGRRALYESFTGTTLAQVEKDAARLLERTEHAYRSRLALWAVGEAGHVSPRELHCADSFRLIRAPHLDPYFASGSFRAVYAGTLMGLGIRVETQRNLRFDEEMRAGKSVRSACFPVSPPEDVRLVAGASGSGADFYRRTLFESGRAQMFAWSSREAAAKRPELIRSPDRAAELGHAFLFSSLLTDTEWLAEFVRARRDELREAARSAALIELHDARRDAALCGHALTLDREPSARSEPAAEAYAESLTRATGFRRPASAQLLDADEWFSSVTRLRARAFAAGFREHLRSRHGRRWFASRAAGDELIDVWNTASRYRVEELARLLWGGDLSLDLAADAMMESPGE